jgi:hypothetical protein
MKIETPKFKVEYQNAVFTFKYGTERDVLEIVEAQKGGRGALTSYFQSRLISVDNLEIDGKVADKNDLLDLPSDVLAEILTQWISATIEFKTGVSLKKKQETTELKSA